MDSRRGKLVWVLMMLVLLLTLAVGSVAPDLTWNVEMLDGPHGQLCPVEGGGSGGG